MEARLNAALADVQERTRKMYARDGEIKIVRERNERAEKDLAELRSTLQQSKEEFQKQLDERDKTFAAERERMDTAAAFHRIEAETSAKRTAWPGSARRRMPRGMSSSSQTYGESYAAAPPPPPVAPTTPTKRGRNQRQLTSSPSERELHESPSKRSAMRRGLPSLAALPGPTPKRTPGFAGFDNSFTAAPPPPSTTRPARTAAPTGQSLNTDADATSGPSRDYCQELQASRKVRLVWAVAGLYRRKTNLLGLLLTHATPRPQAPLSLPASKYLDEAIQKPTSLPDHTSTLHRLLNVSLPANVHASIAARQRAANNLLLQSLAEGASNSDGERRFAFLSRPISTDDGDDEIPKDDYALVKIQENDHWHCEEATADGMQDLWDDIATSLRVLMGLYLRLCMTDALQDVLALMTSVAVIEPQFVNSLMMDPLTFEMPQEADEESQEQSETMMPARSQAQTQAQVHPPKSTNRLDIPPFPNDIKTCVIEAVRKASAHLPLRVLHPDSAIVDDPPSTAGAPAATQSRNKAKRPTTAGGGANAKNAAAAAAAATGDDDDTWDMGASQREDVLHSVLGLLETLVWHMSHQCGRYLKPVFEAPGFIMTFLDTRRDPSTMQRFVGLLTQLVQYKDMWKCLVACHFDADLHRDLPQLITRSRTPLLEVLAKHLVDLRHRQTTASAHSVHCSIVTLLAQLVIKHADALVVARESRSLFAALIQSIHTDTSTIWNDDGWGSTATTARLDAPDAVSRIVMDVRLLAFIFAPAGSPHDLIHRLNSHESHLLLNGISHCFIVAFNRLAFADEPSWMDEDSVRRMQEVADLSSDLIEMVLSPDEVEAAWEVCGAGDEEMVVEGDEGDDGDAAMAVDGDGGEEDEMIASTAFPRTSRAPESFTQSESRGDGR